MSGLKGTQLDDAVFMNKAIEEFQDRFREKFLEGIKEHNPNGDKGMIQMTIDQKIKEAKKEVMDLWAYLHALEYYHSNKELL